MLIHTPHWRHCFQPAVPLPSTTIFVRRFKQNFNILETPVLPLGSGHEENAREGIAALLTEFLPATEKAGDEELLEDARVTKISPAVRAPSCAVVPRTEIHCVILKTPVYRASMLPRTWKAPRHIDFEHLVLLGNQGIGKNKIIDRLRLLYQLREYIQLHRDRDSTVQQLMFQTSMAWSGTRTRRCCGRWPTDATSLSTRREKRPSTSSRYSAASRARENSSYSQSGLAIIVILGNHFMRVLGISAESECKLLTQLAPELGEDLIVHLIGAFHDLRQSYKSGSLSYLIPFAVRSIGAMTAYPGDELDDTLRDVFDFDVYRIERTE
ncbi:hypothetical protein EDB83DRAFT_2524426 [Lactarius deliciosus]|nr:hypothetical protein EDB83DRAFT_2524426 [Lactarius deliciosus]